jgi:hypothetical protein
MFVRSIFTLLIASILKHLLIDMDGLFGSQAHFAKPNLASVAENFCATKCGKSWQKIHSMTDGPHG